MKNQNIFLISSHCLDMAAPAVEGAAVAALRSVMARVRYAAERSGRDPELIRVVAVSKTKPVSLIRQVYDAGHRCFGENYVHEILDKAPQVSLSLYSGLEMEMEFLKLFSDLWTASWGCGMAFRWAFAE